MMLFILLFLAKRVRSSEKARFPFLDRLIGPHLGLAIAAGSLLAMAYGTRSVLALEFTQSLFELIP